VKRQIPGTECSGSDIRTVLRLTMLRMSETKEHQQRYPFQGGTGFGIRYSDLRHYTSECQIHRTTLPGF